jgi:hypothetical protein
VRTHSNFDPRDQTENYKSPREEYSEKGVFFVSSKFNEIIISFNLIDIK